MISNLIGDDLTVTCIPQTHLNDLIWARGVHGRQRMPGTSYRARCPELLYPFSANDQPNCRRRRAPSTAPRLPVRRTQARPIVMGWDRNYGFDGIHHGPMSGRSLFSAGERPQVLKLLASANSLCATAHDTTLTHPFHPLGGDVPFDFAIATPAGMDGVQRSLLTNFARRGDQKDSNLRARFRLPRLDARGLWAPKIPCGSSAMHKPRSLEAHLPI
jgi:hypothetical protein